MRTARKREPLWKGVTFECEGKQVASIGLLILPDTYNPDASLWNRRAGKTGVVTTRKNLAAGLREWRASGDKRAEGSAPIARFLGWALRRKMEMEAAGA